MKASTSGASPVRGIATIGAILGTVCLALADWQAHFFSKTGTLPAQFYAIGDGVQAGTSSPGNSVPTIWHGTVDSIEFLSTAKGWVFGLSGGQFVGELVENNSRRAVLWEGPDHSLVELNPAGALYSTAKGVHNGMQVGTSKFDTDTGTFRAGYWTGSAASWVRLADTESYALGIYDGQIVGSLSTTGTLRACLWNGTPDSYVRLSNLASVAYCAYAGRQGGEVETVPTITHATLWSGTLASAVDIHPASRSESCVLGMYGISQAGYTQSPVEHAAYWEGSSESYRDLHDSLPPYYQSSRATGVWSDAQTVYVCGYAKQSGGQNEPVLWTLNIGEVRIQPTTFAVSIGKVSSGNVVSLGADDGNALKICKFVVPNSSAPIIQWTVDGTLPFSVPASLSFRTKVRMNNAGAFQQTVEMANFAAFTYDLVRTDALTLSDQTFDAAAPGAPQSYVGSNGLLRSRVSIRQVGVSSASLPCASWELLNWIATE